MTDGREERYHHRGLRWTVHALATHDCIGRVLRPVVSNAKTLISDAARRNRGGHQRLFFAPDDTALPPYI